MMDQIWDVKFCNWMKNDLTKNNIKNIYTKF